MTDNLSSNTTGTVTSNSSTAHFTYTTVANIRTPYRVRHDLTDVMEAYMEQTGCAHGVSASSVLRLLQTNICEYNPGAHTSPHNWMLGAAEFTSPPLIAYLVSHTAPFGKTAVVVPDGVKTVGDFVTLHPPPDGMKYIAMPSRRELPHATAHTFTFMRQPYTETTPFPTFYSGTVLMFFPVPEASTRYIECVIGNVNGTNKAHVMIPSGIDDGNNMSSVERQEAVEACVTTWMLEQAIDPTQFRFGRHTYYSGTGDKMIKLCAYGDFVDNPTHTMPGTELDLVTQYIVDMTTARASSRSYSARDARDTLAEFLEYFDGKCFVRVDERRYVHLGLKARYRETMEFYDTYSSRFIREDFMPITTNYMLFDAERQRFSGSIAGDFQSANEILSDHETYLAAMVDNVSRVTYTHPATQEYDHIVRAAVNAVRRYDWLYPFQKETVEDMIRREYSGDGIMGMLNTRITGKVGDYGVFHVDRCYRRLKPAGVRILRKRGGILADEPGLGKTRQSIALVRATKTAECGTSVCSSATLVVVKPNVLRQWRDEIECVWPDCRLAVYHGTHKKSFDITRLRFDYDIVLTTYTTFVTSNELHGPWGRAMFDESHDMSRRIESHYNISNVKWCITGTPVKGLKRMITFLLGGMVRAFGTLTHDVLDTRRYGNFYMRQLVLRKTLARCVNFPPVPITDVVVEMTDDERAVYGAMRERVGSVTECSIPVVYQRYAGLVNVANFGLYAADVPGTNFTETVGGHFTLDGTVGHPPEDDLCPICIDTFVDPCVTVCGHWFCTECMLLSLGARSACPMCRATISSRSVRKRPRDAAADDDVEEHETETRGVTGSKVARMMTTIEDALRDDGRKVIVFFPSRFMVDAFAEDAAARGISVSKVHGQVPMVRRQKTFAEFQDPGSSCRVIAATVKTMSDGITLTMATDILIATPTGRNAIDSQIIGRANRIGRDLTKPLNVVRYAYADTVEEKFLTQQLRCGSVGSRIVTCFY